MKNIKNQTNISIISNIVQAASIISNAVVASPPPSFESEFVLHGKTTPHPRILFEIKGGEGS